MALPVGSNSLTRQTALQNVALPVGSRGFKRRRLSVKTTDCWPVWPRQHFRANVQDSHYMELRWKQERNLVARNKAVSLQKLGQVATSCNATLKVQTIFRAPQHTHTHAGDAVPGHSLLNLGFPGRAFWRVQGGDYRG
eukprot:1161584-Pelagomonas_calceolata.AAC.6